jgi:hypothetical protein
MTFQSRPSAFNLRYASQPLSIEEMQRIAPAAFAETKHESRSERYAYIPTRDVIAALMREGFQAFSIKQGGSRIPGKAFFTKHMIRFRHPWAKTHQVGDTLPEVILINSHDGTSCYRIIAGLMKLACLNGIVIPDGWSEELKVGHSGNVSDKVIEGTWRVIDESIRQLEIPRQWSGVELSRPEQIAFAEAAYELRFDDASEATQKAIKPGMLLEARRTDDVGPDLWRTFNRVQENVTKGGLSGLARIPAQRGQPQTRRVTTRPVNDIDRDVKLNRALMVLAQKMAELKA